MQAIKCTIIYKPKKNNWLPTIAYTASSSPWGGLISLDMDCLISMASLDEPNWLAPCFRMLDLELLFRRLKLLLFEVSRLGAPLFSCEYAYNFLIAASNRRRCVGSLEIEVAIPCILRNISINFQYTFQFDNHQSAPSKVVLKLDSEKNSVLNMRICATIKPPNVDVSLSLNRGINIAKVTFPIHWFLVCQWSIFTNSKC